MTTVIESKTQQAELERTPWLIQRLHQPRVKAGATDTLAQAFCFGGGGGRLSKEAWELLSPVFHFDYMGAAEFEFGAVPKALSQMIEFRAELEPFKLTIPRDKIEKRARRVPYNSRTPVPERTEDAIVHVFCRRQHRDAVSAVILQDAAGKLRLKELTMLTEALDPINDFDRRTVGWLELDNGFFFSIDETMFRKFCGLFLDEAAQD